MNMLPNSTTPSAAYLEARQEAEAVHGATLFKYFAPASPGNGEVFSLMLLAMTGEEELARMMTARRRYDEQVRREMLEYYETGRVVYEEAK